MTVFEPGSSDIERDCAVNCATTTVHQATAKAQHMADNPFSINSCKMPQGFTLQLIISNKIFFFPVYFTIKLRSRDISKS